MDDSQDDPVSEHDASDDKLTVCACVQDPFAALPPELRPKSQQNMGGMRKVTCPVCGLAYWTNRTIDLCMDCEKSGIRFPRPDTSQEE